MPPGIKSNHVHKLKRHRYKSTGMAVFFCIQPDCNYKIDVALSLGKRNLCNRCGNEFLINERAIRQAVPHCDKCVNRKAKNDISSIASIITDKAVNSLRERLNKASSLDDEETML